MIWTWPKQIGPIQNDWYSTKMIWMVQNHFGLIEGQGISKLKNYNYFHSKWSLLKNVVILSEKREFSRLVTKIFFSPLRLIMWFNSQLKQTRTNVDHLYGHVTNPKWIQTSYGFSLKISDPVLENRTIGQFFSILAGFVL